MFTNNNDDSAMIAEQLKTKWSPLLDHKELEPISNKYRRNVTAILLENQEQAMREQGLWEAAPANHYGSPAGNAADGAGGIKSFNPVLISLVRRAMPNLMAYDICGVQPMTGPTGLIFALKAKYDLQSGNEALFDEATTTMAGAGSTGYAGSPTAEIADPFSGVTMGGTAGSSGAAVNYLVTGGYTLGAAEKLGDETANKFGEMAFTIDRTSVVAKTRALKAEYTTELAQDLKAVHGLDAETELANILSNEILAEINREVVRSINNTARLGCQQTDLYSKAAGATQFGGQSGAGGVYSIIRDTDGRWSSERFAGLLFQIERECNVIARQTRRGKGNVLVCSSDVASALSMAGHLSMNHADGNMVVDDTGNTFVGTLRGGALKVYIDPYAGVNYCTVGYRGSSPYDAGMFYCPYVPLQMVRAVGENSFQPKIGFKTRYGLVNNPFVGVNNSDPQSSAAQRQNMYYRIFRIDDLHGINSGSQAGG